MRFAALPEGMGTSQNLAGAPQTAAALPRAKGSHYFPWRPGIICLVFIGFFYAFSNVREIQQAQLPATSPLALPLPAWIEIPSPQEIFSFKAREFSGDAKHYVARRHRTGGGRQDILTFGGSTRNASLINILIYQPGDEAAPESSFYVELARRAAEAGRAIIRAEQPVAMATRLGDFEVARIDLDRETAAPQDCLGFRFANAEPNLRITGFACSGAKDSDSPFTSKAMLTCLLDGIDLGPTVEDKTLIDFFAAHYALRSPNCPGPAIDPVPLHPSRSSKMSERRRGGGRQRAAKDNYLR